MATSTARPDVFDQVMTADDGSDAEVETKADDEAGVEGDDEQTAPPGRVSRRRRGLVRITAALLLVVLVGSWGFLGWRMWQQHQIDAASASALTAAREYAVVLTTLDSTDIDGSFQKALAGATGEFRDAYSQGSAQLRQLLVENKATGQGVVVDAAVKSASTSHVEVLLFVDQSITNAASPSPRIDRNRIVMTMEQVDGRWLASRVEIL